jgi:hypothetical protein
MRFSVASHSAASALSYRIYLSMWMIAAPVTSDKFILFAPREDIAAGMSPSPRYQAHGELNAWRKTGRHKTQRYERNTWTVSSLLSIRA